MARCLATTYIWTFLLALALYALLTVLLVAHGAASFIVSRRRAGEAEASGLRLVILVTLAVVAALVLLLITSAVLHGTL